jgi:hypothetical protein
MAKKHVIVRVAGKTASAIQRGGHEWDVDQVDINEDRITLRRDDSIVAEFSHYDAALFIVEDA